jgi:DNA ligase-1
MKPMLAAATDGSDIRYPVLVSPKLDGIRALVIDGEVLSRSLKLIPNKYIQSLFGRPEFNGFDGELVVGDVTAKDVFQKTSSGVMSIEGEPEVTYFVFDDFTHRTALEFQVRIAKVKKRVDGVPLLHLVPHALVHSHDELMQLETSCVAQGYEGIMIRDPKGQYKHGRSTLKQGWLLKLKRFEDSEAKIIGYEQLMHNANEAKQNELGQQVRSSEKAGKEARPLIGAIKVRDVVTGVEFDIGTGFTQQQRRQFWRGREYLVGKLVKYKYQPSGVKEKPRFPVFLGFRDARDL